jgi:hypothetical protein
MPDELGPRAWRHVEQCENDPAGADHGWLKRRPRLMRRLRTRSHRLVNRATAGAGRTPARERNPLDDPWSIWLSRFEPGPLVPGEAVVTGTPR